MIGWLLDRDLAVCLAINRRADDAAARWFGIVSRLGDGPLWVALVPLLGLTDGWGSAGRLAGALACAGGLYRITKQATGRARPHDACPEIRRLAAPLDRYSFPSGHTLHAVAATVVLTSAAPESALVLWPFTTAIALSRVVLGLHYPSDVLAGAALGAAVGWAWAR